MSDFDPNDELDTSEQADAYVDWCATNFLRLTQNGKRTFRAAVRCAHWLLVVSTSMLHLDESVEHERDPLQAQITMYAQLARALERQREHFAVERLIVLRSSLDCWSPVGDSSEYLLDAAKAAVSVLILTELHPLVDLWELGCSDVWALLDAGVAAVRSIVPADEQDMAVAPDDMVIAKFTWQRARGITRRAGLNVDLEPN